MGEFLAPCKSASMHAGWISAAQPVALCPGSEPRGVFLFISLMIPRPPRKRPE